MKKSLWARLAVVFAVLALALSVTATPAYAATKTVKKGAFTTSRSAANRRAKVTVKKGTTKLAYSKGQGYVKFTAPATKTYTFTMSGLKCASGGSSAYFYVMTSQGYSTTKYIGQTQMKTKGGKSSTMWLSMNGYKSTTSDLLARNLPTRSGKIRLSKGETVFVYLNSSMGAKVTATLKIR